MLVVAAHGGTIRAQSPVVETRLQFLPIKCWCPDDYRPKPLPPAAIPLCPSMADCYGKKPLPPTPPCLAPIGPDIYCRKPLPNRPWTAEPSFLCVPHWATCAGQ
ncbi:MAG TPA: hypothetical protein VHV08_08485 [Pirellulales bacterium]|nr:hypothetical protein [Pirellulales bacterium]